MVVAGARDTRGLFALFADRFAANFFSELRTMMNEETTGARELIALLWEHANGQAFLGKVSAWQLESFS
jgi:hypothetical protein